MLSVSRPPRSDPACGSGSTLSPQSNVQCSPPTDLALGLTRMSTDGIVEAHLVLSPPAKAILPS